MIKVKKLQVKNLGRLVGEHDLDLSLLSDLTQIDGENKNTGGSSGSGKTSLFLALEYLFGVNDVPASILQSRLTKDPIGVSLDLEIDGKPACISRGKSGLSVQVDGQEVAGSSKVSEEALDNLLGFNRTLLRPLLHKRQGEKGFFLSMTPKETYGFLVEMLDLESFTKKQGLCEERASALNDEVKVLLAKTEALKGGLESSKSSLASLEEPKKDVDPRVLLDLEAKIAGQDQTILKVENELRATLNTIKKPELSQASAPQNTELKQGLEKLKAVKNSLSNQLLELKSQANALKFQIKSAASLPLELKALEAKFEELKEKISHLKNKNCPTCLRAWEELGADARLEKSIQEAKQVAENIKKTKESIIQAEELPNKEAELEKTINQTTGQTEIVLGKIAQIEDQISESGAETAKENQRLYAQYQEQVLAYENEIADIMAKHEPVINSLKTAKELWVKALLTGKERLRSYEAEKQRYDKTKGALDLAVKTAEAQLEEATQKINLNKAEALVALESARFLKSYVTQLFFGSMAQIGERATSILKQIPNMNTATITFDTARETKSGKVKEEVSAVLSVEGEVSVPIKSLSGGERAAIDLAVDLAVSEMIECTTGKGIDLLILDEPFDGLDTICKEQCLEVLRLFKGDRKILIVDHSNETKAAVPNKIKVIREGQFSRIEEG